MGLVLALVAREHAYLEGPPGCGKSALARAAARVVGRAHARSSRFHRDASAADLLGEREPAPRAHAGRAGERIALELAAGPSAHAEVLLLDDLVARAGRGARRSCCACSRSGGSARLALPLESALATAGAAGPRELRRSARADASSTASRSRCACAGSSARAASASRARCSTASSRPRARAALDTERRHALQRARGGAADRARDARRAAARGRAPARAPPASEPALLTDRAFARAAPAILRAHALVRGAAQVEPADVRALRFMLARRVPEALEPERRRDSRGGDRRRPQPGRRRAAGRGRRAHRQRAGPERRRRRRGGSGRVARGAQRRARRRRAARRSARRRRHRRGRGAGRRARGRARARRGRARRRPRRPAARVRGACAGSTRSSTPTPSTPSSSSRAASRTARASTGARGATRAARSPCCATCRRRWRAASRAGPAQVVAGLVRVGARRRMRLGYVEFNHEAERFAAGGAFFHRRYRRAARARRRGAAPKAAPTTRRRCAPRSPSSGRTAGRERHIVLLSDGVPVLGDPAVRARARAGPPSSELRYTRSSSAWASARRCSTRSRARPTGCASRRGRGRTDGWRCGAWVGARATVGRER